MDNCLILNTVAEKEEKKENINNVKKRNWGRAPLPYLVLLCPQCQQQRDAGTKKEQTRGDR